MPELVTSATPLSEALLGWFVETTLVASALAVLILLATRLRWLTPGPAARHVFWLMVLLKLVTPPVVHWPWSLTSPALPASMVIDSHDPTEINEVAVDEHGPVLEVAIVDFNSEIESDSPCFWSGWPVGLASVWLVGSVALGLLQTIRLVRFGRNMSGSIHAPDWLIEEAAGVGLRMDVRVPEIRVVPHLGTPLIWCLGRPVLLVPDALLKSLEAGRWRAIVAHELAHLRRGDHWVRRLEMVAGLAWWWCPLYWWVCRRIDFEAELACDAWAVWESPRDRVSYAESLIRIGTKLSLVDPPAPALGMAGTGRSFERRLTMILKDRVERHISMPSLLLATVLASLALPSWTFAGFAVEQDPKPALESKVEVFVLDGSAVRPDFKPLFGSNVEVIVVDEPDPKVVVDPAGDKDKNKNKNKDKDKDKKTSEDKKATKKKKADKGAEDAEAKMNKAIEQEIETKFGPGSDFAKKMEKVAKDIEVKFSDGSDFAKQMEALGKELEAKFGTGSDFAKGLEKGIQERMNKIEGETKKPKMKIEVKADKANAEPKKPMKMFEVRVEAHPSSTKELGEKKASGQRAKRIEAIQSAIDQLQQELKALKGETDKDKDDDDN